MSVILDIENEYFEESGNRAETLVNNSSLIPRANKRENVKDVIRENNSNTWIDAIELPEPNRNPLLSMGNTVVGGISDFRPNGLTIEKGKKGEFYRRVQQALAIKTATLTKYLDAYGVIHSFEKINRYRTTINARIYDVVNNEFIDDISFDSTEFSESDQKKLVENAIFYWHVGCEITFTGKKRDVSEFRLRRVINK